jgi:hypothetical protein
VRTSLREGGKIDRKMVDGKMEKEFGSRRFAALFRKSPLASIPHFGRGGRIVRCEL